MIVERGIVIHKSSKYGTNRTLTLLLKNFGKIYVRGAEKFGISTQIFSCSEFFIQRNQSNRESKNIYLLERANLIENLLPRNYINSCYAMYFCELVDKYLLKNITANPILILLLKSLKVLQTDHDAKYLARIFELKFMKLNGFAPHVSSCHNCGLIKSQMFFDGYGLICLDCVDRSKKFIKISGDTINFIHGLITKKFDDLVFKTVDISILKKIIEPSRISFDYNIDLKLDTKKIIRETEDVFFSSFPESFLCKRM